MRQDQIRLKDGTLVSIDAVRRVWLEASRDEAGLYKLDLKVLTDQGDERIVETFRGTDASARALVALTRSVDDAKRSRVFRMSVTGELVEAPPCGGGQATATGQ